MTLNYGNYGMFLIAGNAGFISSTVRSRHLHGFSQRSAQVWRIPSWWPTSFKKLRRACWVNVRTACSSSPATPVACPICGHGLSLCILRLRFCRVEATSAPALCGFFMLPLSHAKDLSALKFTSMMGLVIIALVRLGRYSLGLVSLNRQFGKVLGSARALQC